MPWMSSLIMYVPLIIRINTEGQQKLHYGQCNHNGKGSFAVHFNNNRQGLFQK